MACKLVKCALNTEGIHNMMAALKSLGRIFGRAAPPASPVEPVMTINERGVKEWNLANEKAKEITLGEDFGAVAITVNGKRIEVSAEGGIEIKPANGNTMTAIAAAQEAYKIGDRLKEGKLTTVIFGFDENKDPIRVPESVFVGNAEFYNQDKAVAEANERLGLKGQKALTRLNDQECAQLAKVWDKVAPPALQGSAAPWFWGASDFNYDGERVYRGGEADWGSDFRYNSHPVPAALCGPVRS